MRVCDSSAHAVSLEIDCFPSQWTQNHLHSRTEFSGWLRYCWLEPKESGKEGDILRLEFMSSKESEVEEEILNVKRYNFRGFARESRE